MKLGPIFRIKEWIYFVVGVALSILMLKTLRLHTDNTQITDKAMRLLLDGVWTHFGNQASHVGNLPGTLLTVLSAGPMAIYFSIWSALFMVVLFHIISYWFLRKSVLLICESSQPQLEISITLLGLLYWLNPWRVEQAEFYNVGYLYLFSSLHIWTALKMKDKNFWLTFFHTLAVGLCVQFHFSFFILLVISSLLFIWNQIRISWWGWSAGVLVSAMSLAPYLIERYFTPADPNAIPAQNLDFVQSQAFPGRGLIFVYPLLKGILYFFRLGSTYFGRHIFSEIEFSWIENENLREIVHTTFHVAKFPITIVTLLVSFYLIGRFLKSFYSQQKPIHRKLFTRTTVQEPQNRFHWYFFAIFLAVVIAGALTPVDFSHWHFVICLPAVSLFMVLQLRSIDRIKRHFFKFEVLIVALFVSWNLFAAFGSRSHEMRLDYSTQFYNHYKEKRPELDQSLGRSILFEKFKVD